MAAQVALVTLPELRGPADVDAAAMATRFRAVSGLGAALLGEWQVELPKTETLGTLYHRGTDDSRQ